MKQGSLLPIVFLLMFLQGIRGQNIFRTVCSGDQVRLDSMLTTTSIDTLDRRGRTLLHWAVACKQSEVLNNLLDRQKDTEWQARHGGALLELIVFYDNEPAIEKLIQAGININQKNTRGSTALEIAQRLGKEEIANALLLKGADPGLVRNYELKGRYLGQVTPGSTPELFAPNFISTEEQEFGSVFNRAGNEFYFGVDIGSRNEIRRSKMEGNRWSKPEVIVAHEKYGYNDPFLSNDEERLYFISNQALDGAGEPKDIDIWYCERTDEGWSEPINAGSNINTPEDEYYISFASAGTMYFSSNGHPRSDSSDTDSTRTDHDIYYSEFKQGEFQPPVRLPESINTAAYEADVYIAPDESYIIFCSTREEGLGGGDLYISFKDANGTWSEAINMGDDINSDAYEFCPYVTPDGKFLFYTSNMDIYWVSTTVLEGMRNN
ncbi:WD40-like Beta Propeller Repeat [Robiginitalea myxolifaciens]|uniref:WD40-like Beta Propeller Repeat n=1 Tax=Robiginitalea myxolifaciens TaxID=400055 RepID=A0A1I6HBU7_9FLAO|nr:hypothetical protein [Robiginitalea myxolifaciens]SFR51909.1 WD40-like Beta Propeller Repeat [Robiginitalea myxolifaciens]